MREYQGPEGDPRIWYEPEEIEEIFQAELRRSRLAPPVESPTVDVERFIESHLKVSVDQYAELPQEVLGLTRFDQGRPPKISINATLTEAVEADPSNLGLSGRWRATLAHEAAHVVLHRHLFDPQMAGLSKPLMPSTASNSALFRCAASDISPVSESDLQRRKGQTDWREVQANRGMAALLMPASLFRRVVLRTQAEVSISGSTTTFDKEALVAQIAAKCGVSRQAASIRIDTLGLVLA